MCKKIIIIAAAICIILTFTTCETLSAVLQEPVVSFHSAEVTRIDFNGTELLCKIRIDNPNAIGIPFPEVAWQLFLNNNSFVSGVFKASGQRISAQGTTFVDVPVRFTHVDVFKSFQSLMGNKQAAYRVALDTKFSIPIIGGKTWHFEHRGDIPLLQLPAFRQSSMRVESVNLTRAEILVTTNVDNPNTFDIPRLRIGYDYSVNRNSFLRGSTETAGRLAASSVTPVSFRFIVNYTDLYRSFQSLLTSNEVSTLLSLTVDFANDTLKFEIPGTLPLRP